MDQMDKELNKMARRVEWDMGQERAEKERKINNCQKAFEMVKELRDNGMISGLRADQLPDFLEDYLADLRKELKEKE